MTVLRSERLALAPFSLSDADALFQIRGDAVAMEFWDWPADQTSEETQAVASAMLEEISLGATWIWTIRRADDNSFVGIVDLSEIGQEEADLGFMLARECWGRGYAFEAASTVVAHAWRENLSRLCARTHAGNTRSHNLLLKLGFVQSSERDFEVRPGVMKRCALFTLEKPTQGSSSLSQ
jgi:RimJ/RimL family protein N-acetyltransferase